MQRSYPEIYRSQGNQEGSFRKELRDFRLDGGRISIQGKEAEPWQAAETYFREPSGYMMDFIPNSENRIIHIDFVRIGKEKDGEEPDDFLKEPDGRYIGWCG